MKRIPPAGERVIAATTVAAAAAPVESKPHAHHHGEAMRRWLVASTAICLAAGLCAWALEWIATASSGWLALIWLLYAAAYVAGGWHTALHAWEELRSGKLNIDVLMLAAALGSAALGHFADGAALLFLFSLSQTLETLILGRTRRAIADLMHLAPEHAVRLTAGREERVPVEALERGDVVIVHPGERLPADGRVRSGQTSIDQSPMTGESIPVDKQPGDEVFSGTLNQQGVIQVEVTHVGGESTLARMVRLVEEAQSQRAVSQRFTEWFGERYTWVVIGLSAATLMLSLWLMHETWTASFQRAMTVLVVASPCAVVISIPAAILAAITSAALGGVLVKGGAALEDCARLQALAFDKTGTLTVGKPRVVDVTTDRGLSRGDLLELAAALEAHSEHPLAIAVCKAAQEAERSITPAENVSAVTGHGIEGQVGGRLLRVGKTGWFQAQGPAGSAELVAAAEQAQAQGRTVLVVADASRWLGVISVADTLRPSAAAAVQQLRALGLRELTMLTGDAEPVARNLASLLNMSFQAGLLPDEKLQAIQRLHDQYGPTGMIGDGMNDAPSLAAATVGFSLGGAGTHVALETADVVLLADDLRRLPHIIALARRAQQIVTQNLAIAFGMMALLLVSTFATHLPLPLAVLGHEGSTVVVILNGLRLLRFPRPKPLAQD
jgi:Cd2+/Zn2+-exporting ATPase